jgi:NADH-quinone oxidoreductase subunit C
MSPVAGLDEIAAALGGTIDERWGTVTLTVPVERYLAAADALAGAGLAVLDRVTAVDEPDAPGGPSLDVVAVLVRDPGPAGPLAQVLLRTRVAPGGRLPSLTTRHRSAAWHEREVVEMFGVEVDGFVEQTPAGPVHHPRPLLTAGWDAPPAVPPLRTSVSLPARAAVPWPGAREPLEPVDEPGDAHRRRAKGRRPLPPGVPA